MMSHASLPGAMWNKLCKEAFNTATKLDNLIAVEINGKVKARYEHVSEPVPKFAKKLQTWGEAGVVTTGKDGKIGDRGSTCIFVSYADNHDGDCYRMFNPKTNQVLITWDVTWLKQMYYSPSISTGDCKEPGVIIKLPQTEEMEAKGFDLDKESESIYMDESTAKVREDKNESMESDSGPDKTFEWTTVTRSDRTVQPVTRYIEEIGTTAAEINYFATLMELEDEESKNEFGLVDARHWWWI